MLKKVISLISAAVCAVTAAGAVTVSAADVYSDVSKTHWAYQYIERCSKTNYFMGYPDGTFHPDATITRAEALKVFVTFNSIPVKEVTHTDFVDLSLNAWYAPYVEAGKDLFPQRTTPDGQSIFQPEMPVTREDVMYGIVKILKYDNDLDVIDQSILNMYADQNSISQSVRPYIAKISQLGIVEGDESHRIDAQEPLSRAAFAKLLSYASDLGTNDTNITRKIVSIDVYPSVLSEMLVGDAFDIKANAHYSDGSTEDYSLNTRPYAVGSDGVVNINNNQITAVGEGTVIIKFNDENLNGSNSSFPEQQLVVTVKDARSAPVVQITDYPAETAESSAVITGKIIDSSGTTIALSCNNSALIMNSDGTFTANVNLADGINKFEFKAVNGANKEGSAVVEINKTAATPEPTEEPSPEPAAEPPKAAAPEPTKEAVYAEDDPLVFTAELVKAPSEDDKTAIVKVSYSGLTAAKVVSAGFVLGMDANVYTYDASASSVISGGIMRYQKTDGGVRFSYSSSQGLTDTSGELATIAFKVKDGSAAPDAGINDFSLSSAALTNNTVKYDSSKITVIMN